MQRKPALQSLDANDKLARAHQKSANIFKGASLVVLGVSLTLGMQAFLNDLPEMNASATALGISACLWFIGVRRARRATNNA